MLVYMTNNLCIYNFLQTTESVRRPTTPVEAAFASLRSRNATATTTAKTRVTKQGVLARSATWDSSGAPTVATASASTSGAITGRSAPMGQV